MMTGDQIVEALGKAKISTVFSDGSTFYLPDLFVKINDTQYRRFNKPQNYTADDFRKWNNLRFEKTPNFR